MSSPRSYSLEDERIFRELTFTWTKAWDTKDLQIFLKIAAPQVVADYTAFEAVGTARTCTPEEFWASTYTPQMMGNPKLRTQHLLGAAYYSSMSETKAIGSFQARAWHVREFDDGRIAQWDCSSYHELTFVKLDGEWKIGGWRPNTVVAEIGKFEDILG